MKAIVEAKIESFTFPDAGKSLLKQIDFTVYPGEFVAVNGKTAAGKSLLLSVLTGEATKFNGGSLEGSVKISGVDRSDLPLNRNCEVMGYMAQEPQNQLLAATVEKEVAFGLANMEYSREEIKIRTTEALSFVGLNGLEERKTESLSGGQAQRLVLAGIFALKTPLLLLDQPGAELDMKGKRELYHYLRRLNQENGVTVIMVADAAVPLNLFADRVLTLDRGTLVADVPIREYREPEKPAAFVPPFASGTEKLLELKEVSYTYKRGVTAVEHVDFSVYRGDFVAVMGENGSGKTTLLKLMEGLLFPTAGTVMICGEKMTKKNVAALRQNLGFLFQNPDLQIFASSLREEVAFGLGRRRLTTEEIQRRTESALAAVGLAELADVHPQRLSNSQRQKLAFASALVGEPALLIADEPTAGLNAEEGCMLMELLTAYRRRGGTVILVTHDGDLAKTYANRVLLLTENRLKVAYEKPCFSDLPAELFFSGGVA